MFGLIIQAFIVLVSSTESLATKCMYLNYENAWSDLLLLIWTPLSLNIIH